MPLETDFIQFVGFKAKLSTKMSKSVINLLGTQLVINFIAPHGSKIVSVQKF